MQAIDSVLSAARQYWLTAGASEVALANVQINIDNLPTRVAAQTVGHQITLSADGAGWGWFVDTTPGAQEELIRLCEAIGVSPASVFPETTTDAPREFLATAKLVASYCRKLHALGTTSAGVSFLSLPPTDFDDDSFFDDDHNNDDISWEVEEELDRE